MGAGITFRGFNTAGGFQGLAAGLMRAAMPRIVNAAELTRQDATDGIIANASSRHGQRQGKARSEPLTTRGNYPSSLDVKATGVVIKFNVEGSAAFMAKFGALNYGSGSHKIPVGTDKRGKRFSGNTQAAFRSATGVTHPGTTGSHFWDDAIDDALRYFRNRL